MTPHSHQSYSATTECSQAANSSSIELPRVRFRGGVITWLRRRKQPLLFIESGEFLPRRAFVELSIDGYIDAYWRSSSVVGEPPEVIGRAELWFEVSPTVDGAALVDFLNATGLQLLNRVHQGRSFQWPRGYREGVFTLDAEAAIQQFKDHLLCLPAASTRHVISAPRPST
jgi:hypothetical protein